MIRCLALWIDVCMRGKYSRRVFCYQYTLLFGMLMGLIVTIFVMSGKSFVWYKDGIDQHYPIMVYLYHYIRSFLENIVQGKFVFPMMDYRIGQGMDVVTTLNYYGFGDPFLWITALFPEQYLEAVYAVLLFLRLYLSGIFFGLFCFQRKQAKNPIVLIGALLYVFSGYGLCISVRHPFFLNGMLFLPLFLMGVERILAKKKYGFLAVFVGFSMSINFYFTYMNTVLMGLYILIRFVSVRRILWREKVCSLFKIAGTYLMGLCLSAFLSVPVIMTYLQCSRGGEGGYQGSLLHYPIDFYQQFVLGFLFPSKDVGGWTYLSYTFIGLLGVVLLYWPGRRRAAKKGEVFRLRLAFLLLTGMCMVPLVGKVMNGFGYVCNRWNYGYAMLVAYLVVRFVPEGIGRLSLCLKRCGQNVSCARVARVCRRSLTVVCVALLAVQIAGIYIEKGYLNEFVGLGQVEEELSDAPVRAMRNTANVEGTGHFFRVEQPWDVRNRSLALNYFGNSWYYSIIPQEVSEFYRNLGINTLDRTYSFRGLDGREELLSLGSVKYYVTEDQTGAMVPFGFQYSSQCQSKGGKSVFLYQNAYHVPLGYTIDCWMPKTAYDKLNPIEKQEALQQGAVLEDEVSERWPKAWKRQDAPAVTSKVSSCTVTGMQGMKWENGILTVEEGNATMDLAFSSPAECETYLWLKGLETKVSRKKYQTCTVQSGDSVNYFILQDPEKSSWYSREYQTVRMGYSDQKRTYCRITIPSKGKYYLEDIQIISQPMEQYSVRMKALSENTLEHLSVGSDKITGDISLDQQKLMVFSIPCRKGWTAYVDGKETELLPANGMYMALPLSAGKHQICLRYQTPYLKEGVIVSGLGIIMLLAVWCFQRLKKADRNLIQP